MATTLAEPSYGAGRRPTTTNRGTARGMRGPRRVYSPEIEVARSSEAR